MKFKGSWKALALTVLGFALAGAATLISKPVLAGPALVVYQSPT